MSVAIVSGASGFIGRRLCERLRTHGWDVHPLSGRSSIDIADRAAVLALAPVLPANADVFFHIAGRAHAHAESTSEGEAYRRVNVVGTANALELATQLGVHRFVLAGSVAAIGPVTETADERHPCSPSTEYGRSKLASEALVLQSAKLEGVVLRFPMVFGGKDRGNMTRMVEAVRRRRFPPFPATGNRRSIIHVDDAVDAFVLASTHPAAAKQTFIVTDGNFYSTRQIYESILRALGRKTPRMTPPLSVFRAAAKAGDLIGKLVGRRMPLDTEALSKLTDSAAYSSARIQTELGFRARRTLEEGLRSIVTELSSPL